MKHTAVKICGLTRPEDAEAVNAVRPDCAGFVFAESRRQVDAAAAALLRERLDPAIRTTGVFVNESPERIVELCRRGIIGIIQLHGDEPEETARHLREETGCPVVRAVRVQNRDSLLAVRGYPCDALLLDAWRNDSYGGGGVPFDWSLIGEGLPPFFLAGGLTPENVARALDSCRTAGSLCGVDVSSGVESDGRKDPDKIHRFVSAVREWDRKEQLK